MKYLVLILFVMSFATSEVHANYAYAQAGVGYYGGTVPCPYGNDGRSGAGSLAQLEAEKDKIEDDIDGLDREIRDLMDLDHEDYDEDSLPLKESVASVLLQYDRNTLPQSMCSIEEKGDKVPGELVKDEIVKKAEEDLGKELCLAEGGLKVETALSQSDVCNTKEAYDFTLSRRRRVDVRSVSRACNNWLDEIKDLQEQLDNKYKELDDVNEKIFSSRRDQRKIERARRNGEELPEGVQCTACDVANPEPKGPSGWQIAGAAATDIINGVLMYRGIRYVSDNNKALGWDTSPVALGAYYPHATARLYNAYRGGGQGAGSWGCAQTINGGYPNGAAGIWGPNGPYSQYGNAGGPFYAPQGCNYGCVNPYAGNGPFMPGIGPWGAAGPWGSNGVFPYNPYGGLNAYANLGINLGGGGNPYGNPFGGGLFGGNPLGGLYGQGGLGLYGQGQFGNPFGGPFGGGQFGNPYGGIFGGNPYGNPFGGGNMYGNPFGGGQFGLGNDYQMQMMQMQMQQQQAYFQAQQRALQNQMVVSQQVYGLQMEYQQLMQRYQRIMQYSAGGYLGGNVSIYGNLQLGGSYNPYSSQYYVPGSNITNPPNGESPTGR